MRPPVDAILQKVLASRHRHRINSGVASLLPCAPGHEVHRQLASVVRRERRAPVLAKNAVDAFSRWYAGEIHLSDPPPGLAPGRAADLTGLPPAGIAVAGHDRLRDDRARYAELLAASGVTVDLHLADTLVHGYLGYAGVVPAATEATERGLAALRAALHA